VRDRDFVDTDTLQAEKQSFNGSLFLDDALGVSRHNPAREKVRLCMQRSRLILALITSVALSVVALGRAWAGAKYTRLVQISSTSFYGSVGSARASAGTIQYIGCGVSWDPTNGLYVECDAQDANGYYQYCTTQNTDAARVALSVNNMSWIYATFDSSNHCTKIEVGNDSADLPSTP
jgi:hypothetical protein